MILLAALALAVAKPAPPFDVVKNGRAAAIVAVPAAAPPPVLRGAREVASTLGKMSGTPVRLVLVRQGQKALLHAIHIGMGAPPGSPRRPLASEQFRIVTTSAGCWIDGGGSRGALYGCSALLEDVLGCRWYTPEVTRIPRRSAISLPVMDWSQKPGFEYREPYYYPAFNGEWAVHNRTNGHQQGLTEEMGGRVEYGPFVHTFAELVPPEKYFAQHPEYFSEINGKRMNGIAQLCLTNPDVLKIVIAGVREWVKKYPRATIFSVSQNDTYFNCQCASCRAVEREEGAASGPLLRFVNAVADAIRQQYPHLLIDTLAYQWSEDPPRHVTPRPNVRVRLAPIGSCVAHGFDACPPNRHVWANLQAWSRITRQLYVWHYSTDFANFWQPLPDLEEIARDIPLMRRTGVVGLFYEGDFTQGPGGDMGELKAYLMAKLMWNPDRAARPIIEDYVAGVYGPASPYILRWLDLLQAEVRPPAVRVNIYDPPTAAYLPDRLLQQGDGLFTAALEAAAGDAGLESRVRKARMGLDYVELARSSPEYRLAADRYAPQPDARHAILEERVRSAVREFHIANVSEPRGAGDYLAQLSASGPAYPVIKLHSPTAAVTAAIVPGLGGRIISFRREGGPELMWQAPPGSGGYPNRGGYEEYTQLALRSAGWNAPFQVRSASPSGDSTTLEASLPGSLMLRRTITLAESSLHIRTELFNRGAESQEATIRSHPEFEAPADTRPITFRGINGSPVAVLATSAETGHIYRAGQMPDRAWRLMRSGGGITVRFDPAQVDAALLDTELSAGRANLELIGKTTRIAPGASIELDQEWVAAGPDGR